MFGPSRTSCPPVIESPASHLPATFLCSSADASGRNRVRRSTRPAIWSQPLPGFRHARGSNYGLVLELPQAAKQDRTSAASGLDLSTVRRQTGQPELMALMWQAHARGTFRNRSARSAGTCTRVCRDAAVSRRCTGHPTENTSCVCGEGQVRWSSSTEGRVPGCLRAAPLAGQHSDRQDRGLRT
jgi:hypothetical protein